MKKLTFTVAIASVFFLNACKEAESNKETAADIKDTLLSKVEEAVKEEAPLDSAAQMKAWEDYMTPNEMHKMLAASEGKWNGEATSWEPGKTEPSGKTKMVAEYKMILGGRYQEATFKGDMMGMPFEGKSIMGYDNAKKKFTNTWIDNFGTGIMYTEGTYDEATQTINMSGKMMDPAKGKETDARQVYKRLDDKTEMMEMYCVIDGKEFKSMEIKYTRK